MRRRTSPSTCTSLVLLFIAIQTGLDAQTTFGSVVGTVSDASNATIPGVKVTLTNLATSEKTSVASNTEGLYRFLNLRPAQYRIDAELSGFKQVMIEPISVEVQSTVRIDLTLQVGGHTETVEVAATTPLVQTETSSLGQVVEGRKVAELPLNGRNPLSLIMLVPSVVPQGGTMQSGVALNVMSWGNFQIGGGTANQSIMFVDGVPMTLANISVAYVPTQDTIQEFKVQTNSLSSEFGRFSGGVVNLAPNRVPIHCTPLLTNTCATGC